MSGVLRFFALTLTVLILAACGSTTPKGPLTPQKQDKWVRQQLAQMSLEQKLGQMMVLPFGSRYYTDEDYGFRELQRRIRDYHIGGVIFFSGNAYTIARDINRLQAIAPNPLMVMADIEWGISMRVKEGTTFLQNMAIGATGSAEYAREMGRITGEEARALGIHVGFAPVMDVNNNPDNIIINTRSYGEDPEVVGRLGSAFIQGMQEAGVIATAKHFPGHGDTDVDSHLGLPTIPASAERLRELELKPFRMAVEAGVKCIMVAHITYSAFPQMQGRPATLDPYFIEEVLRKEMGFKGLVVTDAMDMGGITNHYWPGQAAVMAINAGNDLILMPPNFDATFEFVLEAARSGRIPLAKIDQAVTRILKARAEMGLLEKDFVSPEEIESTIGISRHEAKAGEMARKSMTLLRNERGILPLAAEKLDSVLVITVTENNFGNDYAARLGREVRRRVPGIREGLIDPRTSQAELDSIIAGVDSVDAIVMGVFVKWGSYKGSISLPDTTVAFLHQLLKTDKPVAVAAFGSPYVLRYIPEAPSYLCAFETNDLAVGTGVAALFGEIPVSGKIPVSIPGLHTVGDGIQLSARAMTLTKNLREDLFADAFAVIEKAIADTILPGAQVAIVRDGELLASRGIGHLTYAPDAAAVDSRTIYDLASVTKVMATTLTAMEMEERRLLALDVPVSSYLPQFSGAMKDSVTIRHLLTHCSGLPAWTDLWNQVGTPEQVVDYICGLDLIYAPGDSMVYSDLGIILVKKIMEMSARKPLDQLAAQYIYKPLGLDNTFFNPDPALMARIAPTEIGGGMNRGLIRGAVHDENAMFLGGVSSHAGLFSTAEDLAAISQMLINGGIYNHRRIFKPETISTWTTRQEMSPHSGRAIGWDTPSDSLSSAGDYFSPGSFGHLGFTGTSVWVDPHRKIAVVLLSNRVHPTRERGGMYGVRRDFYNAAMRALLQDSGDLIQEMEEGGENNP